MCQTYQSATRRSWLRGVAIVALLPALGACESVFKTIEAEPVPQAVKDAAGYLNDIAAAVAGQLSNLSALGIGGTILDKLKGYATDLGTVAGTIAATPAAGVAQTLYAQAKGVVNAIVDGLSALVSAGRVSSTSTAGKIIGWAGTILPVAEALLGVTGVMGRRMAARPGDIDVALAGLHAAAQGAR